VQLSRINATKADEDISSNQRRYSNQMLKIWMLIGLTLNEI
jgi:hypothetical protein